MEILEVLKELHEHGGLRGRLLKVNPSSLAIASEDFYVRKGLNEEHVQNLKTALQEGAELPPAVVCYVKELSGYRIVDGNHTAKAHQELGLDLLVVDLGELSLVAADRLQVQLNPPDKLALRTEDLKEFARRRWASYASLGLARKDRREVVRLISQVVGRAERTVYLWLSDLLEEKNKKTRELAVELLKEGQEVKEVAKALNLSERTVGRWQKQEECKKKPIEVGSEVFWQVFNEYYDQREKDEVGFEGFENFCKRKGYQLEQEWENFKEDVLDLAADGLSQKELEKALTLKGFPRRTAQKVASDFSSLQEDDWDAPQLVDLGSKGFLRIITHLTESLKTVERMLSEASQEAEGSVKEKILKSQKALQRAMNLLKTASEQAQAELEKESEAPQESLLFKSIKAINHVWNYYFKKPLVAFSDYGRYGKLLDQAVKALVEREKVQEDLDRRFINALLVVVCFNAHGKTASVDLMLQNFLQELDSTREFLLSNKEVYSALKGRKISVDEFSKEVRELVNHFWNG